MKDGSFLPPPVPPLTKWTWFFSPSNSLFFSESTSSYSQPPRYYQLSPVALLSPELPASGHVPIFLTPASLEPPHREDEETPLSLYRRPIYTEVLEPPLSMSGDPSFPSIFPCRRLHASISTPGCSCTPTQSSGLPANQRTPPASLTAACRRPRTRTPALPPAQ